MAVSAVLCERVDHAASDGPGEGGASDRPHLCARRNSNMSDETTINMFWQGPPVPPLVWACMRSFVHHGHRVRVFSYSSLVVPAGVTLEDAHDVHPSRNVLDNHPAIAQHADIFRYHLLYKYGGWWVDTDVYCLTGNLPVQPYAWAEQEPGVLNNAILKFPKGDALCGELLAAALARSSGGLGQLREAIRVWRADVRNWRAAKGLLKKQLGWEDLGPKLVTEVLGRRQNIQRGGSQSTFYPWHWLEASFAWLPRTRLLLENRQRGAQFLHFWSYALRSMGVDLYKDPPTDSLLAYIIRGCPNRVTSDAYNHLVTERAICAYMRQGSLRDKWKTIFMGDPLDLFPITYSDSAK